MGIITSSMLSGIGNSIETNSVDKNYNDMNKFNFMYMWIAGWCTICMLNLYQPFMFLWMGNKYMLSFPHVILLCLYFYALKMGDIRTAYSDATGLWWETRYRAIAETVANCLLNYFLGKYFGLIGIILATLISLLVINFGYGSSIIFKYYFKGKKLINFFKEQTKYFVVTFFVAILTYLLCSLCNQQSILNLIIRILICIIVPNVLYLLIYWHDKLFIESRKFVLKIIKKSKK